MNIRFKSDLIINFKWNKIPHATPRGATHVTPVSFTYNLSFYIHNVGDKKKCQHLKKIGHKFPKAKLFFFSLKNIKSYFFWKKMGFGSPVWGFFSIFQFLFVIELKKNLSYLAATDRLSIIPSFESLFVQNKHTCWQKTKI